MHTPDTDIKNAAEYVLKQMRQVIVGKDPQLAWIFATILSGGHILLEDIPGVGKTTMAVGFSKLLGLNYSRVQFTPDVLPSDITGFSIPDQQGGMTYRPGAILCNLFLADELNRATSRTQSALLEAMEEHQVTVDGVSHPLPKPFIVIATQNPTGAAGTQLLPDSQMDRFSIRLSLGYPNPADEVAMVRSRLHGDPLPQLNPILSPDLLAQMQQTVAQTFIGDAVVEYIVNLIDATRHDPRILRGASPRATLCMADMAKAIAQLGGRDYVVPKDVQKVFLQCIPHRLLLAPQAEGSVSTEEILHAILAKVNPPRIG